MVDNWINQNKEWLFSGVGATFLYFLFAQLRKKQKSKEPDPSLDQQKSPTKKNNIDNSKIGVLGDYNTINNLNIINNSEEESTNSLLARYLDELAAVTDRLPWGQIAPEEAGPGGNENLRLSDVYTALDTTEPKKMECEEDVRECLKGRNEKDRVSAQQMINDHPRLVLLGDPGSGKTTLVNFIAHLLARAKASQESEKYLARLQKTGPWDHGSMLPIRIVLRDYAAWLEVETSESKNLSGWLQESLKENKLQKLWPLIHKGLLAENQQIFIMLDGLDEVPVSQRRNVVTQINNFAENYCHNRYLVTCRIYAYVDKAYQLGNFSRTILAPFSKDQINHFNDAWYQELAAQKRPLEGKPQELAARLKTAVKGDDLLELAERPLILTVIALLHTSYGQLPEDRVELYKWAVELLLRRWKGPEGGNSLASFLGMPKLKMSGLEAGLYEVAFQAHSGQTH